MDLHTPSKWTFWLSVILVVLAIILRFAHIRGVEPYEQYASWIGLLGYIVLVIGCIFKTTTESRGRR
jgi:amino acid transporter